MERERILAGVDLFMRKATDSVSTTPGLSRASGSNFQQYQYTPPDMEDEDEEPVQNLRGASVSAKRVSTLSEWEAQREENPDL